MRVHRSILLVGIGVLAVVLSGCAVPAPVSTAAPIVAASSTSPEPTADAAAQEKVDSWIDGAGVPDGAVRSETSPEGAQFLSWQGWTCDPMALATGYWTVSGATISETANWIVEHPIPGLISTSSADYGEDVNGTDELTFGNIPEYGAQEGVAFSIVPLADGVAIRAEGGAIPAETVCQTPEPGTEFGSPGEG